MSQSSRVCDKCGRRGRHHLHQLILSRIRTPGSDRFLSKDNSDTPVIANRLVAVLRTLIAFGVPRGHIDRNPATEVVRLPLVDVENARPWPEDALKCVL
jgi:hypothetical protein